MSVMIREGNDVTMRVRVPMNGVTANVRVKSKTKAMRTFIEAGMRIKISKKNWLSHLPTKTR